MRSDFFFNQKNSYYYKSSILNSSIINSSIISSGKHLFLTPSADDGDLGLQNEVLPKN